MCSKLGATGPEEQLLLSTMSSRDEIVNTREISNLCVRGYNREEIIQLPPAYSRPQIPTERTHIPTPETAKGWPHLERIADELTPLQDVEVGLLIGYNCTQAFVPREVIASAFAGPYAQRTSLGESQHIP
jgi:hypothetical protein